MTKTWQLQEAKNHLSEVVENAIHHGCQTITRHGEPAVMVVSVQQYQKLCGNRVKLADFLGSSPLKGITLEVKRSKDLPRETDL